MPRLGTRSPPSATFSDGLHTAKPCARLPQESTERFAVLLVARVILSR